MKTLQVTFVFVCIVLSLMVGVLMVGWQSPPSEYDNDQFTRIANLETRQVYMEEWVGVYSPTPEFVYTPTNIQTATAWRATDDAELQTLVATFTVTETPTRVCARGTVNTPNTRLRVRDKPNGVIVRHLNHNTTVIFYMGGTAGWVELTSGGWVSVEFLINTRTTSC